MTGTVTGTGAPVVAKPAVKKPELLIGKAGSIALGKVSGSKKQMVDIGNDLGVVMQKKYTAGKMLLVKGIDGTPDGFIAIA